MLGACSKAFGASWAGEHAPRPAMWAGRDQQRLLRRNQPSPPAHPAAVRRDLAWLPRNRRSNEAWLMLHFPSHLKPLKVRGILVVAALAVAPLLIHAQAPPDRTALERFRDSLASLSDSTGLLALEKRLIDSAKTNRNDGLLHLLRGFIALRLG